MRMDTIGFNHLQFLEQIGGYLASSSEKRLILKNGSIFEGDIEDGSPVGFFKVTHPNGITFEGYLEDEKLNGKVLAVACFVYFFEWEYKNNVIISEKVRLFNAIDLTFSGSIDPLVAMPLSAAILAMSVTTAAILAFGYATGRK